MNTVEMTILSVFWQENGLGPLGVKEVEDESKEASIESYMRKITNVGKCGHFLRGDSTKQAPNYYAIEFY